MVPLFADEDFPGPVTQALKNAGLDLLRVQDVGLRGEPDERVLEYATSQGRAVLTRNRVDFVRLHSRVKDHGGIIVCTDDDPNILAPKIIRVVQNQSDLKNLLIRINKSP